MRYCGKCGAKVSDAAVFCTECGCRLSAVESKYEIRNYQPPQSRSLNLDNIEDNRTVIITAVVAFVMVAAILSVFVYFTSFRPAAQKKFYNTVNQQSAAADIVSKTDTDKQIPKDSISAVDAISQSYINTFEKFLPIEAVLPRDLHYGIYDIDKNGIPEFIIEDYYNATNSTYHIYTYINNRVSYIGNYPGVHSSLYKYNGNGFVYFSASNGTGVIRLFSITDGTLSVLRSIDINLQNYYEPEDIFEGAEMPIELHSYHEAQNLYSDYIYHDLKLEM